MQGANNLIIFPNAAYARAFGPLSCTCVRASAYVCVRVRACVRVHVCVRAHTCVHDRTCVHAGMCTCVRM